MFLIHLFSSAESSLATECLFARFRRERCFICIYIYIQRCIYIYICSFMCKFRQSVLSTAETTFCLCVAFCFTARSLWMSTVFGFGKISCNSAR